MKSICRPLEAALAAALLALAVALPAARLGAACNTAPVAVNDTATTIDEPVLIDVLANDTDAEGEALSVSLGLKNCAGTASVDDDGLVTFKPSGTINATCFISYTVSDESGGSASATITITGDASVIFRDTFETGDKSRWAATCPPSCS